MAVTYQSTTPATPPAGTTVDIGSGAANTGTQRTILATDQSVIPINDNGGSITVDGAVAVTQSGAWSLTANQSVNVAQINGVAPTMGNGVSGTGVARVTLASDSTGQVAIAGTVTVASHAVTNAGTFAVQNNAATPTGTAAIGTVTLDDAGTGWSNHALTSAATANATNVKASAARLHGVEAFNSNASARYLKLYNSASAPTAGSGTPFRRYMIPGGGGLVINYPSPGITLSSGLGYTLVTGAADSNSTAVAADEIQLNLSYT